MFRFFLVFAIMILGLQQGLCAEDGLTQYSQEELEAIGSRIAPNGKSYNYPSIMIKSDFRNNVDVGDKHFMCLTTTLMVNGWDLIIDDQGRQIKYISPEISYGEVKKLLNFDDEDLVTNDHWKKGAPQLLIINERSNCEITFIEEVYNGKNEDVKLIAVVYNNKEYEESMNQFRYDKNKSFFENASEFMKLFTE